MIPPIVIFTSDKYLHALRGFAHTFTKFWYEQPTVTVAGFTEPKFSLPGTFTFHSIGKFEDYPVGKWSDAVLDFFDQRGWHSGQVIIMLEDYWLVRRVNHYAIDLLGEYMENHPDVIRMDLTTDRLYAMNMHDFATYDWLDLIISDPNSPYHMSLMPAIWNVAALRKVLIRGESPWDVEIAGTRRLADLKQYRVLGTRQWPIRITLALRNNNPNEYKTDGFPPTLLTELKARGFFEK